MKFNRILVCLLLTLALTTIGLAKVLAATSDASPSSTPASDKLKQIQDLKERLATKVAELNKNQPLRALAGTVKSAAISNIVITSGGKDTKIEISDTLTVIQYLKGVRTKLTLDDVSRGDNVVVFGDYDVTLDLLKARVIFISAATSQRIIGTVTAIDRTQYTLNLKTTEGQDFVVDIETTTKAFSWSADKNIVKSGFSKVTVGDAVTVLGTAEPKLGNNRLSALRILDLGDLTGTPTPVANPTATVTPKVTPSANPTSSTTP